MNADLTLELGRDDHALEVPWASEDGRQRYLNLKQRPELLLEVLETRDNRELGEFLLALNAATSPLETAKCDTWISDEIHPEEEIFGAAWKFGSYVDLIFSALETRSSLAEHERLAQNLCGLLAKAPDIAASAEFVVRRCYSHLQPASDASEDGFCLTVYVSGFGDEEDQARKNWVIGLKVVQNALLQVVARSRV